MATRVVAAMLLLLGSGCDAPTAVQSLPVVVHLRSGNRVRLVDRNITLQFDSLVSDNRCPLGALCIVAGRAVVDLSLIESGQTGDRHILLATDHPDSSLGLVLTAEQVTPFPQVGQPSPGRRQYLLSMRLSPL